MGKAVSVHPKDAVAGGLVLSDANVKVVQSRFIDRDNYKEFLAGDEAAAFEKLTDSIDGVFHSLRFEVPDADEQPWASKYLAANRVTRDGSKLFVAGDDGRQIEISDDAEREDLKLRKNTEYMKQMEHLIKLLKPAESDLLNDDISVLEGMEGHVVQIPTGRKRTDDEGREFDVTITVFDQVTKGPGKGSGGGGRSERGSRSRGASGRGGREPLRESARRSRESKPEPEPESRSSRRSSKSEDNGADPVRDAALAAAILAADTLDSPVEVDEFSRLCFSLLKETKEGKAAKKSGSADYVKLRKGVQAMIEDESYLEELAGDEVISFADGEVGPPNGD